MRCCASLRSRISPAGPRALQQRTAGIGPGATLRFAIAQLGGRVVRSRIDNRLEGDGARVEQVEIVFGGRDQLFDLTAYTRHVGRDTTGNLLSKAVLQHGARAYIKGLISIEKTAGGTDSFLGEFGMLLDKQSRTVTIPAWRSTSRTAGGRPTPRRSARSTPPNSSTWRAAASPPTRPASSSRSGFLEPVVARVPLEAEQGACGSSWRRSGTDALGESASPAA